MERVHLDVYHRAMPGCRACGHKLRDQIDAQLIHGTPYREIAAWSTISLGALHRHKSHITGLAKTGAMSNSSKRNEKLARRTESLLRASLKVLRAAQKKNDLRSSVQAIGASTRLIEMLGRMIPLRGVRAQQDVEAREDLDARELAQAVWDATEGFSPEKIEQMKRLLQDDQLSTAIAVRGQFGDSGL